MIFDLDETIKQLLIQKVPLDPEAIDIMFERPNMEWESRLGTKPTINCFLHDIHENLTLRFDKQRYVTRNGTSGAVQMAPRRIDFGYLITVWSSEVADEHRLLGNVLKGLLAHPILPPDVLQGDLVNQTLPVRTWTAQPEDRPQSWEFWGANEWRLKASISFRITLAVEPVAAVEVGLVQETKNELVLLPNPETA